MIWFILLAVLGQVIASFSQILLKISAGKHYESFIKEYLNAFVIIGYGMLGISMVISVVCYSQLEYMKVVIIEPIGYVIVMFLSRFFFKEKINFRKIVGMVILLAGIIIFNLF